MANQELQDILTKSIRDRRRLARRLELAQQRGLDRKCDEIYSLLWLVNSNIEYCQKHLEAQE